MDLIPVRLLKPYGCCNAGEVAGFVPHVALRLVEQGIAVRISPPVSNDRADAPDRGAAEGTGSPPSAAPSPITDVAPGPAADLTLGPKPRKPRST